MSTADQEMLEAAYGGAAARWEHSVRKLGELYGAPTAAEFLHRGFGPGLPIGREEVFAHFFALLKIAPEHVWNELEQLHEQARAWHGAGNTTPDPGPPVPSWATTAPTVVAPGPDDDPAPSVPEDSPTAPHGPIKVDVSDGTTVELPDLFEL